MARTTVPVSRSRTATAAPAAAAAPTATSSKSNRGPIFSNYVTYTLAHLAGFAIAPTWIGTLILVPVHALDILGSNITGQGHWIELLLPAALLIAQVGDWGKDKRFNGIAVWAAVYWPTTMYAIHGKVGRWTNHYGEQLRNWLEHTFTTWWGQGTAAFLAALLLFAVLYMRHKFGPGRFKAMFGGFLPAAFR